MSSGSDDEGYGANNHEENNCDDVEGNNESLKSHSPDATPVEENDTPDFGTPSAGQNATVLQVDTTTPQMDDSIYAADEADLSPSDQPKTEHSLSEDGDHTETPGVSQADLFGDDLSDSSDNDESSIPAANRDTKQGIARPKVEAEAEPTGRFAGESDEEVVEPEQETVIMAEVPRITMDLGKGIHFVKFPNFLSVEPRPFDADTYEDEIEDSEVLDEEGRSRLKLKCENTIRWRNTIDADGDLRPESNAKIVRWSDGSMSLYLGSEIFDIHVHPLQDHNHVFVRQGAGLQGQSVFRTKLSFRPYSTESFTHRKITMSMADKSSKAQKVKVLVTVGKDPEAQKSELLKKEEERIRAINRRESMQRRMRERSAGRGLSAHFLEDREEDSDDDNTISISAIKRGYKQPAKDFKGSHIYSSDSEAESEGSRGEKGGKANLDSDEEGGTSSKKKARIIQESDEEDA